jgi:hypothetical protein
MCILVFILSLRESTYLIRKLDVLKKLLHFWFFPSCILIKVGKKPGKFEKTHGNWKNWFLPGKMGKREKLPFFQNTCLKSLLNHWQINDGMF